MDLWIKSQDRKKIIKTDYIECGEWNKEYRIYINGEVCGKYKTEERTLKVLDEINSFKDNLESAICSHMPIENYTSTFEMPQE